MDSWRIVRLWLWTAAIVAILGAGGYARLRWGVPEYPYGGWEVLTGKVWDKPLKRSIDPFVEIGRECEFPFYFRSDRVIRGNFTECEQTRGSVTP